MMAVQAVTGLLTVLTFFCGCMDTRTKKKMERQSKAEELAKAPISSVADTEAPGSSDAKYTKV
jgi:hypothetical protein